MHVFKAYDPVSFNMYTLLKLPSQSRWQTNLTAPKSFLVHVCDLSESPNYESANADAFPITTELFSYSRNFM